VFSGLLLIKTTRRMKALLPLVLISFLFACDQQGEEITAREKSYFLHRAGYDPVSGTVTFSEMEPGKIKVEIELKNTDARYQFPAHLHFGSIREVGELAFQLNDVDGATGRSVTILDRVTLSSGEVVTYDLLNDLNGSVKIHMSSGLFAHVVLAYGNVGGNENYMADGIAICTGH
jgi:hypothetical protein